MYFKLARYGLRIVVFRYEGYNAEKRRSNTVMLGSILIADGSFTPVEKRRESITPEEWTEIQNYIDKMRGENKKASDSKAFSDLPGCLEGAVDAIRDGAPVSEAWAKDVWTHVDALGRLLRRARFPQRKLLRSETKGDTKDE